MAKKAKEGEKGEEGEEGQEVEEVTSGPGGALSSARASNARHDLSKTAGSRPAFLIPSTRRPGLEPGPISTDRSFGKRRLLAVLQ
jgi:hypothetical protein